MDYGVVLDLETTGLDARCDKIIEIGILGFAYDGKTPPTLLSSYGAVEDPGEPLKPEITQITGLCDRVLEGRKIDWQKVRELLQGAAVVVAHNASFDSAFIKRRPELEGLDLHWACSADHIDWAAHGLRTRALNYLAADHGFVNPFAHRAVFDCATTFRLIAPYLPELIEKSYEKRIRILARNSPFESKDILKQRGYRWDPEQRVWYVDIFESRLDEERAFLAEEIYLGANKQEELELKSLDC